MRAFVKKLRQGFLLRTAHGNGFAIYDLSNIRSLVVHVAYKNRLRRANNYTRRLQTHIDPMGAEVALLRRMIFRINEDCIVRTRSHAGLAANTNRLVKIDNAIRAFEHCGRGASNYAGSMGALVATRNLVSSSHLRKDTDVDMFDVGAGHGKRNKIFRLTC